MARGELLATSTELILVPASCSTTERTCSVSYPRRMTVTLGRMSSLICAPLIGWLIANDSIRIFFLVNYSYVHYFYILFQPRQVDLQPFMYGAFLQYEIMHLALC